MRKGRERKKVNEKVLKNRTEKDEGRERKAGKQIMRVKKDTET
jgi:hypothetical protein